MKKEQWEKSLRKEVFDKIDDISMDAVTLIKAFIKEQLEQQKAEFLNQPANQHDQDFQKEPQLSKTKQNIPEKTIYWGETAKKEICKKHKENTVKLVPFDKPW
jgi:hypothetical protein